MTLKLETTIPLSVPLSIIGSDGAAKTITSLTLKRPKTRHLKQLALIIGSDLVTALMGGAKDKDVDVGALAADTLPLLFSADRLDAAQALAADLLGIKQEEAGEIDTVDLPAIGKGLLDFFPGLQSIGSLSSPLT